MKILVVVVSLFALSAVNANNRNVFCYYGTWATYRSGDGKFDVDNVDPFLCTHLAYAFVGINATGFIISLDPYLDLPDNGGRDNFRKFTALKEKNPKLKTVLAVGGWGEGSAKYSVMAANETLRSNFVQSALQFITKYNFDGLDLDWEYPNARDTVNGAADVTNFNKLIKELKTAFKEYNYMLSAAVYSMESKYYDVPVIAKNLDLINVMTYDLYGSWNSVTGHNAALHAGEGDENANKSALFTDENSIEYWLKAGAPAKKLLLGVPFYGHTFALANSSNHGVRAPSNGAGMAGPYTASNGVMGYNEICVELQSNTSWTQKFDKLAEVPYTYKDLNWISYDNPKSIKRKVEFAQDYNLGGIMLWSIETDDFHGNCGNTFPLLKTINTALGREVTPCTT